MKHVRNKALAAVLTLAMAVSAIAPAGAVQAAEGEPEYEIYPIPQQMEYVDGTWNLDKKANVVYESGIDEATKARLEETLDLQGMTIAGEGSEDVEKAEVERLFGDSRYDTGYAVADALKAVYGIEKFEAVVVATGKNFADALAGSYLAVANNAPILLTNGKDDNIAELHAYIAANVAEGGKVYILGGDGAVPTAVDEIEKYDVVRLYGNSRYDTNLAILDEAGVSGDSIIVATGKNFADSLSASAAKLPILLVKPDAALNDDQKAVLDGMKNIYIVGGEGAVSAATQAELEAFGEVTRVFGESRYDTSVEVAKTFCKDVDFAVVASGKNFPDGLCGGPLAAALNAPLVLTKDGGADAASTYVAENGIASGYVLGGEGALTDATVTEVFGLENEVAAVAADSNTNILVGIYGSGEEVDQYVAENYELSTEGLFDKTDAYFLASKDGTIAVLGADADAAFYGLTSLYHVFTQVENKEIRNFEIEDWADVVSRGFIEGYYGNPWSLEDRCKLMEWGGYYKLNSYFYAPKDDPKHNANWRELYTEEEIETLIKPLAEAGNNSKCRFVFALHPYMYNAIRYNSEQNYQADLAIMQAKFEQVIEAGVRQIAILADDAGNVGGANYIKTLQDMTNWIKEMQKTYPDLKLTLPFCTQEYMGNGQAYYAQFPENVQIVMTGGRVWGEVSNQFTTTFTNNVGRGPYLWINWPCSDNSKQHLIMGGYTTFLHPGVDASKIQGIVLNPMQQSEPSKVAIFGNACYSWNIWTQEEADQAWVDSFKYVDHNSAIETDASAALRELSKHMINQNMDSRVTALQESVEIKDDLAAFKSGLEAGTVTAEDCDKLIAVFEELQAAAATYAESGNDRIKDQIVYWLNCWVDTTTAAISYLKAVKANLTDDANTLIAMYNEGMAAFAKSRTYGFHYVDHTEYAEVGVQHIVPFISALSTYVEGCAELLLNPDAVLTTYITSRTDVPGSGSVDNITDGDESTGAIYMTPNTIEAGTYVGLKFSKPIAIKDAKFVLGAGKDHYDSGKVQYTLDGKEWIDLNDTVYPGVTNQVQKVVLTTAELGEDFEAMGIRFVAAADNAKDAWLEVREVAVNESLKEAEDEVDTSVYNVIKTSRWTVYSGSETALFDGNDNSMVWYDPNGGSGDAAEVGDFLGYDFGKTIVLNGIHAVVGNSGGDKLVTYDIQITADGTNWETVKSVTGAASGKDTVDVKLDGVEACGVRILNKANQGTWVKFSELTVEQGAITDAKYLYTNVDTNILTTATKNTVSLTPGTVTLGKGEYIGMKLSNIKEVEYIDVAVAEGLSVETSLNGEVWSPYTEAPADARYIRVVNTTDAAIEWTIEKFKTGFYVVGDYAVESNFGAGDTTRDMRSAGNVANVFDGNLSTYGEITGAQIAGKEIVFDLGRTIDFETFRYYIVETNMDYLRYAKFEVSADGNEWTEVLVVGESGFENTVNTTVAKDADYLTHDSSNPGYMFAEAKDLNVTGRYLRVTPLETYDHRWVQFNELQINGGEYVSPEDDKDIVSDSVEVPYKVPSNALDGVLGTSYESSAKKGSFTYRVSEPQAVKAIRLIQVGEVSNATVTATYLNAGKKEVGKLDQCLNEYNVPEGDLLLSVTVTWDEKAPSIAEIITMTKAIEK